MSGRDGPAMDNSPGNPTPVSPVARVQGRLDVDDPPLVIEFVVPAVPVTQPRQRHRVVQAGGKSFAMNYTPKTDKVNAFKATVRMAASKAYQGPPLNGPVILTATFVLPRPQRRVWKTRPMPREPHTTKPDLDNLIKALKDALSALVWTDDCRAFRYRDTAKWIAAGDEQPHVEVRIESLDGKTEEAF